jgi:hypothetical protein
MISPARCGQVGLQGPLAASFYEVCAALPDLPLSPIVAGQKTSQSTQMGDIFAKNGNDSICVKRTETQ